MIGRRLVFMVWVTLIVLAMLLGGTAPATPALGSPSAASGNVELIGQIGGPTRTVAVQGAYAYIGVGPRLVILNISNPAHPAPAGQTGILAGVVQKVRVTGDYAYVVVEGVGLYVIDVATPATPVQVGFAGLTGEVTGMVVMGNYAYVVGPDIGLHIFNLANPAAPTEVGAYQIPEVTMVNIDVAGNYAYVPAAQNGLRIINVANPAAPTEAGSYHPSGWGASEVKVRGDYAYVAANNGLRIIRITNPAAPTEAGSYAMQANHIALGGNFAYLTPGGNEDHGLHIINIANPNAPQAVGFYPLPEYVVDLTVAGNYTYILRQPAFGSNQRYASGGLHIINTTTPAAPSRAGFYATPGPFEGVVAVGHYAYAAKSPMTGELQSAGGLGLINAANPAAPTEVGAYYPRSEVVESVAVVGNYAYIGTGHFSDNYYGGGLHVVNIANPAAPVGVGYRATVGHGLDIAVAGNYVYIAEAPGRVVEQLFGGGLRIFNIANPATPTQVGYYAIPEGATAVAVAGNYAYLAAGDKGLWIFNISKPAVPAKVGAYTAHHVRDVTLVGNFAYLAAGDKGLRIVDITNPATPTEVGSYELRSVDEVAVAGDYAYIAVPGVTGKGGGLGIIKITSPTTPTEAVFYDIPGFLSSVAVANGYIYVVSHDHDLIILRFTPEPESSANPLYLPLIWK